MKLLKSLFLALCGLVITGRGLQLLHAALFHGCPGRHDTIAWAILGVAGRLYIGIWLLVKARKVAAASSEK